MGIISRIAQFGGASQKYFLDPLKQTFIDPIARELERPVVSAIRSAQAFIPGGKTGKESMATPFGDVKPYSQLSTGEALGGAFELATSVPGAGAKLATKVAGPFLRPFTGIIKKAGSALAGSAAKTFGEALAPTTKALKTTTQKITSEALDRGIVGTANRISRVAAKGLEKAEAALDDFGEIAGSTAVKNVTDVLEKAKSSFLVKGSNGMVAPNEAANTAINHIDFLKNALSSAADDTGMVSREALRGFRQAWDATVKKAGGFAGNVLDKTKADIEKTGADAIRSLLAAEVPDLAKINKEYSFFRGLSDVIEATQLRQTGQSGLLRKAAGAAVGSLAGQGTGLPFGEVGGAVVGQKISEIAGSTLFKSATASVKNSLAKALMSKDYSIDKIANFFLTTSLPVVKLSDFNKFLETDARLEEDEVQTQKEARIQSIMDALRGTQPASGAQAPAASGADRASRVDALRMMLRENKPTQ